MVPVQMSVDGVLEIAMVDPGNIEARNVLEFIFSQSGQQYVVSVMSLQKFKQLMDGYSNISSDVNQAVVDAEAGEEGDEDPDRVESLESLLQQKAPSTVDGEEGKIVESAPITKMVAAILMRAIEGRASDIHIERTEFNSKVRYRVDGKMQVALMLPKRVHNAIVARVKILAKLKLDEKRKPQDGRFPARVQNRNIDFRVSTMPTFFGEKVVMRILDPNAGVTSLEKTGMTPQHIETVRKALSRPYGIILITGPTGSVSQRHSIQCWGEVDKEGENVISLEDPVEYNIDGVNQSQVRSEIGYTFASGLRSILRQDPDILMVGEIRDKETAQLAIQAALTGHMVFSTLHTNSSIGVIPRLVDMGVDPYLIAPTLTLAIAQRLVRRTCEGAVAPVENPDSVSMMVQKQFADLPDEFRQRLDLTKGLTEAQATANCPNGTKGRMAVFEMFEIDKGIERIILNEPTEPKIYAEARAKGMITMKEDAILKCMEGLVPFREINGL